MDEQFKKQIEKIRLSGETNMFDVSRVQYIAFKHKWYKLVNWIAEHKSEYANYILTGEEPKDK